MTKLIIRLMWLVAMSLQLTTALGSTILEVASSAFESIANKLKK